LSQEERLPKGTVAFTVRVDKKVFRYLLGTVTGTGSRNHRKPRFKSISEAVNTLLKKANEKEI